MDKLPAFITLVLSLVIYVRLLTFKPRPDSRRRPGIAWCAWMLSLCSCGQAIQLLLQGCSVSVSPWQVGVLANLAIALLRARGNLAAVLEA